VFIYPLINLKISFHFYIAQLEAFFFKLGSNMHQVLLNCKLHFKIYKGLPDDNGAGGFGADRDIIIIRMKGRAKFQPIKNIELLNFIVNVIFFAILNMVKHVAEIRLYRQPFQIWLSFDLLFDFTVLIFLFEHCLTYHL